MRMLLSSLSTKGRRGLALARVSALQLITTFCAGGAGHGNLWLDHLIT